MALAVTVRHANGFLKADDDAFKNHHTLAVGDRCGHYLVKV